MAPAAVWEIVSNPDPSLDDNRTDNTKLRLGVGGGGDSGERISSCIHGGVATPF
jgi:hypothetical protein